MRLSNPISRPTRRALAAAVLVLATAAPAARAAATASALADTSKPATFLREVVVTGTRFPRAYFQSPQSLSFLNRAQIMEQAPLVIGDVLSALPGVDMSKDSPWEQRPVLRGLSGQRVLVLMDGMPMNSARGNGPHPSLVDPSQIERVEVVRGPSSVAYGSDALGGVINVITRQALPDAMNNRSLTGSAHVGGSTAEGQANTAFTLVPHVGRFSAFLAGGQRTSRDYQSPDGKISNSAYNDYNGLANLRYDFTERMALKAGYQQYRASNIGIPGLSVPYADFGPGNNTKFMFRHYNRDEAHVALDHSYPTSWLASSHVNVYWQKEQRDFWSNEQIPAAYYAMYGINFDPNSGSSSFRNTNQDRYFDLDTYGLQIQATSRKTDTYRFTAGIDAARDVTGGDNIRQRNYHWSKPGAADSVGTTFWRVTQSLATGKFDNYAGFFQNEWFVTKQWTASVGARYTKYRYRTDLFVPSPGATPVPPKSIDNGAACGSLGLVYSPTDNLHLTANVANGYREPNAQDLFFNGPASVGVVLGNPDLNPEKSVSYDGGARWSSDRVALAANVFYSTYKDLINALPVAPGTYQYLNVASATIYGADLEAELHLHPQVTIRTTASDQVGDITSASAIQSIYGINASTVPLEQVPPFKGTTSVRWNDVSHTVWVEVASRYSWRTDRLPPPIPGVGQLSTFKKEYVVGDVMVGATIENARLEFGLRNFTDRSYRPSQASVEDPGISGVASLSVNF
jgi:hemoglobin/transferrin/lactoferrin receptor protein